MRTGFRYIVADRVYYSGLNVTGVVYTSQSGSMVNETGTQFIKVYGLEYEYSVALPDLYRGHVVYNTTR